MSDPPTHLELATCDYPEQSAQPLAHAATAAAGQRALGLAYVRLAEFAWSSFEPREGHYAWSCLDGAIDAYAAEGLKVVLCTPTATPPAWLTRAHPEILPYDLQGRVRDFGSRRHYDFASPIYREHSKRITRAMAERYGNHPAVVGWQTDNEFGCHATGRSYGGASAAAFPAWLQQRYGTLAELNTAWGNAFWSMDYDDWAQIRPPNLTVTEVNPAHQLDYYRFCSSLVVSFQAEQVAILRDCSPGRFITHNFMIFESGFDHYEVARGLDFVSWDSYPTGMLEFFAPFGVAEALKTHFARTGHPDLVSFNHDLYRGLLEVGSGKWEVGKDQGVLPTSYSPPPTTHSPLSTSGFWVMEQQCGQVNWAPHNPLPAGGAVKLWTAQAWAHGADVVSYFRWQAARAAQEIMHSGLLRHDGSPDRGHGEVAALDLTAFPLGEVRGHVALLHDYESLWIYDAQPHSATMSYWTQLMAYYGALRSLGLDVDVLHPDADLGAYPVVIAPALTLMTPQRSRHLTDLAAAGKKLVFGPRTAFRTVSGGTPDEGQFGPLTSLIGARLENFDSLRPGLSQAVRYGEVTFQATSWAESYRLEGARTLASYVGGPLGGQSAVIRRGNVTVIGAHDPELIGAVLSEVFMNAGFPVEALPDGVRLSRRAGKLLVQNWNPGSVKWRGQVLPPVSFSVLDAPAS